MSDKVRAATVDDRRRVVLPEDCPPNAAVTVQQLDRDTWLIKRQRPSKDYKIVLIASIDTLPDDPKWEAMERNLAEHAFRRLPPPEE